MNSLFFFCALGNFSIYSIEEYWQGVGWLAGASTEVAHILLAFSKIASSLFYLQQNIAICTHHRVGR
jgi:hypothetical protein